MHFSGSADQDVFRALDEVRARRDELSQVQHRLAEARAGRAGVLASIWLGVRATVRGEPPFAKGGSPLPDAPGTADSSARDVVAHAEREIRALERRVGELTAALDDAKTLQDETIRALDSVRVSHFDAKRVIDRNAKEAAIAERARVLDERRLENAHAKIDRLREQGEADRSALHDVATERDAARAAAAKAQLQYDELQIVRERERIAANERESERGPMALSRLPTYGAKIARLIEDLRSAAAFVDVAEPDVTVIVPAYNYPEMTIDCLASIVDRAADGPTMQLVVVDDASPDRSLAGSISLLPFVTLVCNGSNLGFLRSCNRASLVATGRYLLFLNNDTLVQAGWLRELVACAEADPSVGAVGSKLLFEDGALQEAGGIIWSDASGWNYGRGDDPEDPRYNYVREVDYCSGASLLVRADLFASLGRFDDRYAPAYFEDSDLCFAIRARGKRVMYQPKSVVTHLEGVSSGKTTDAGIKRHQVINKPKFVEKWQSAIAEHHVPESVGGLRAARRLQAPKTLVMIDNYVPEYDKDSGSNKLFSFIKLFGTLGYNVIYVPDNFNRSEPYTTTLQNLGVEVLYGRPGGPSLQQSLRDRLAFTDVVWIGRPDLGEKYIPIVREFPAIPILYDTHDLHYVRVRRELELKNVTDPAAWREWEASRDLEMRVVRAADVSMTVTDIERRVLEEAGVDNVFVMPNVHESYDRKASFEETEGIIFIGGYVHGPNVDAALWLCNEIMPIVWATHPHVRVTLIGSNVPNTVSALASDRVEVAGFVPDVTPIFERARLMVAPLRFGAGLKGKIGQAFAYALPTVTTAIGAEGFDMENGRDALIEETAGDLARAIVRAYDDRALWQTLSQSGARIVKRFGPDATRERLAAAVALGFERRERSAARP